MEERDFGKYLILLVAVVAVVGLLTTDGFDVTGFAAKKAPKAAPAKKAPAAQAAAKVPSLPVAASSCAVWLKTSERSCNSPPRQNQILAKYTCKSDASKYSWRLESTCGAAQRCQNGACVDRTPVGQACRRNDECQAGFVCRGGTDQVGHPELFTCQNAGGGGGVACDENADCAQDLGYACRNGACTLPVGAPCTMDNHMDCASNLCGLTNYEQRIFQCAEPGVDPISAYCRDDRECASGICGREENGDVRCVEGRDPLGARCELNAECASGACGSEEGQFDRCVEPGRDPAGAVCFNNVECASNTCSAGYCT